MNSAIYEGWVEHRRHVPVAHRFRYRVFLVSLDLDEIDEAFRGRWLWSARRPALARYRRSDYLGDPTVPLADAVRDLVEERGGARPTGPIRLLTHLRYFGYVFNPVSFYLCYSPDGKALETVVAEITNTPWNERHAYVLGPEQNLGDAARHHYRFAKDFHVSPFFGMDYQYDWRISQLGDRLTVQMQNERRGEVEFDATLSLERRPWTGPVLARILLRHPFMTAKVILAIYWQALRLWIKRCPFVPHPRHAEPAPIASERPLS